MTKMTLRKLTDKVDALTDSITSWFPFNEDTPSVLDIWAILFCLFPIGVLLSVIALAIWMGKGLVTLI